MLEARLRVRVEPLIKLAPHGAHTLAVGALGAQADALGRIFTVTPVFEVWMGNPRQGFAAVKVAAPAFVRHCWKAFAGRAGARFRPAPRVSSLTVMGYVGVHGVSNSHVMERSASAASAASVRDLCEAASGCLLLMEGIVLLAGLPFCHSKLGRNQLVSRSILRSRLRVMRAAAVAASLYLGSPSPLQLQPHRWGRGGETVSRRRPTH